jgi:AraC-like DNA-binding protein
MLPQPMPSFSSRPARQRQGRIAQIAAQVGYESEAAFSRAFKKLIGSPPAEWRRAHAVKKGDEAA